MLARYMLSSCVSVCPSARHKPCVVHAAASDDIKVFWCRPIMLERWTCDVVTERSQVRSPVFPLSANNLQSRLFANRVVAMQTVNLVVLRSYDPSWWRGTVVERRSLAGELSLSCARPAADG